MRERPNYNWIEEVRAIPKMCSCCGSKVKDWESVIYECYINYLICEKCTKKDNAGWPKAGYYTIIDDYQDDIVMTAHKGEGSMDYI